jgi:hypothetical protein
MVAVGAARASPDRPQATTVARNFMVVKLKEKQVPDLTSEENIVKESK